MELTDEHLIREFWHSIHILNEVEDMKWKTYREIHQSIKTFPTRILNLDPKMNTYLVHIGMHVLSVLPSIELKQCELARLMLDPSNRVLKISFVFSTRKKHETPHRQ